MTPKVRNVDELQQQAPQKQKKNTSNCDHYGIHNFQESGNIISTLQTCENHVSSHRNRMKNISHSETWI